MITNHNIQSWEKTILTLDLQWFASLRAGIPRRRQDRFSWKDKLFVHWKNIQTDDRFPRLKEGLQNLGEILEEMWEVVNVKGALQDCILKKKLRDPTRLQNIANSSTDSPAMVTGFISSLISFPLLRVEFGLMMTVKRTFACDYPEGCGMYTTCNMMEGITMHY